MITGKIRSARGILGALVAITLLAITSCTSKGGGGGAAVPAPMSAEHARELGVAAYIYGYPLVTMEMTRRVITNVAEPKGSRAPMGQLIRLRQYPNAAFRDVTAPNADTLYTTAFVNVGKEPWVLSLPDGAGRYYLFPMLDGWTNIFDSPGTRTTGTGPQTYAITGPGWSGTLPDGVKEVKSPTSMVWLLGRIYCSGTAEDYDAVHKMQDAVSLVPLSSYGQSYTPPMGEVDPSIDMKTPVREQVNALSTQDYFDLLAKLLKDNPPAKEDGPIVAKLAELGIVPGEKFDMSKFSADVAAALQDVPKVSVTKITSWMKESVAAGESKDINGWVYTTKTGSYGTDYLQRAMITYFGLGANLPLDAVYPTSEADAKRQVYMGSEKYVMHFEKGQFPPVNGFWSLTMYNEQYFFVDNPLNRYNLSARDKFTENADGSVDLYLQHEDPGGEKTANWLPAPSGRFVLMLRMYWPKETAPSILDGSWTIPGVVKGE